MSEVSSTFALIAGLLTFFSACLIPIIPVYLAYLSGITVSSLSDKAALDSRQARFARRRVFLNSLYFVLGFSIIFILLGMAATFLGQFFIQKRFILQKFSGIFIILLGFYLLGLLKIPWLYREFKFNKKHTAKLHWLNSLLFGMAFGFSWTPCVGPILASILFLASLSQTMWEGAYLLALFSLGLAIPFLIISLTFGYTLKILPKINRHLRKIQIITGLLIIGMGVLLILGKWEGLLAYFIK